MHTDRDAFLAAVLEAPDDARPRLIFADWLDEHGEPERAEFIRVQCSPCSCTYSSHNRSSTCARCCRERELLSKHIGPWADFLPDELVTRQCPYCEGQGPDWETGIVECRQCECTGRVPDYDGIDFRRGFVEEIACPWSREHIAAIRRATPLRRVRLTTWPDRAWVVERHRGRNLPIGLFGRVQEDAIRDVLAAEFPGVEFVLMPYAVMSESRTVGTPE